MHMGENSKLQGELEKKNPGQTIPGSIMFLVCVYFIRIIFLVLEYLPACILKK